MGGSATRMQLRLADERRIDYLELGDPAGVPAVYLHGTPSSASEARWLHRSACAQGVRLVSLDRPGYLQSEPNPCASLIGVAQDVLALAQALELGRFAVVGSPAARGTPLRRHMSHRIRSRWFTSGAALAHWRATVGRIWPGQGVSLSK